MLQRQERNWSSSSVRTMREHGHRSILQIYETPGAFRPLFRVHAHPISIRIHRTINRNVKRQSEWSNLKQRAVGGSRISVVRQPRAQTIIGCNLETVETDNTASFEA